VECFTKRHFFIGRVGEIHAKISMGRKSRVNNRGPLEASWIIHSKQGCILPAKRISQGEHNNAPNKLVFKKKAALNRIYTHLRQV
jgi:hypothetical protein